MASILAIDAGGTRTRALVADASGKILGRGTAGPANPLKVGFESCEREILRAARMALRRTLVGAGLKPAPTRLEAVVVGLAGVDRPPVHHRLLRWLKKAIPARRHLLTSDAAIALAAAIGSAPGIVIISGTGSIGYAEDELGRAYRSGGWGTLYDDAGSGYDLGRKAIVAALRDHDGRGSHTRLQAAICRRLGLADITRIILKPLTPQQMAALSPLVSIAASRGDTVARRLLEAAGEDLADLACALLSRSGWRRRPIPVVVSGGVFRASALVRQSFARSLRNRAPHARVVPLRRPAVEGALALARELAGES